MPAIKANKLDIAINNYINGVYIEKTPKYSWYQALKDSGYSKSYAKGAIAALWNRAEKTINEKLKNIEIKNKWDLEWCEQQLRDLYDDCRKNKDRTNSKGCLDSMIRRKGGFTDNLNTSEDKSPVPEAEESIDISENKRKGLKLA